MSVVPVLAAIIAANEHRRRKEEKNRREEEGARTRALAETGRHPDGRIDGRTM